MVVVAIRLVLDTYIFWSGFEMLYRDLKGEELSAKEIIDRFLCERGKCG